MWGTSNIRFESINALGFHLYFLDEKGAVVSIHNFYSFLDHRNFIALKDNTRQFHRDFTVPEGAVAFALGYDGETGHDREADSITFPSSRSNEDRLHNQTVAHKTRKW